MLFPFMNIEFLFSELELKIIELFRMKSFIRNMQTKFA
jgi:hypothetical protein